MHRIRSMVLFSNYLYNQALLSGYCWLFVGFFLVVFMSEGCLMTFAYGHVISVAGVVFKYLMWLLWNCQCLEMQWRQFSHIDTIFNPSSLCWITVPLAKYVRVRGCWMLLGCKSFFLWGAIQAQEIKCHDGNRAHLYPPYANCSIF